MTLDPPEGDFLFAFPWVEVDPRNSSVHLVWAEFEPGSRPRTYHEWGTHGLTSLWHSRHTEDGWSQPQLLFDGYHLHWGYGKASVLLDRSGVLHVAFGAFVPRAGGRLVVVSVEHLEKTTSAIPVGDGSPIYVSLATNSRSEMVAAAISSSASNDSGPTSIYLLTRDGVEWSAPRVLPVHPGALAMYLTMVMDPKGVPHLLWARSQHGPEWPSELVKYNVQSGKATSLVRSESGIHAVGATVDSCGTLHVLYHDLDFRATYLRGPLAMQAELQPIVEEISANAGLAIHDSGVSLLTVVKETSSGPESIRIRQWKRRGP